MLINLGRYRCLARVVAGGSTGASHRSGGTGVAVTGTRWCRSPVSARPREPRSGPGHVAPAAVPSTGRCGRSPVAPALHRLRSAPLPAARRACHRVVAPLESPVSTLGGLRSRGTGTARRPRLRRAATSGAPDRLARASGAGLAPGTRATADLTVGGSRPPAPVTSASWRRAARPSAAGPPAREELCASCTYSTGASGGPPRGRHSRCSP